MLSEWLHYQGKAGFFNWIFKMVFLEIEKIEILARNTAWQVRTRRVFAQTITCMTKITLIIRAVLLLTNVGLVPKSEMNTRMNEINSDSSERKCVHLSDGLMQSSEICYTFRSWIGSVSVDLFCALVYFSVVDCTESRFAIILYNYTYLKVS